jgi:hypothetical protein
MRVLGAVAGLSMFGGGFVGAMLGVEAGVGEAQALYGTAVEEVFVTISWTSLTWTELYQTASG